MPAPRRHLGALSPDGLNTGQPWTAGTSLLWSLRPRQGSEGTEPSRRRKQQPVIPRAGSRGMAWAGSEEGDAAVQGLPYNSPEKRPLALAVPRGLSTATHHVRAAHRPVLPQPPHPSPGRRRGSACSTVARSCRQGQKDAGGSPAHRQPQLQTQRRRTRWGSRPHFPFSFLLPLRWPVSWSSFLSSLLCSWALLAGSRDLSLVPLPA